MHTILHTASSARRRNLRCTISRRRRWKAHRIHAHFDQGVRLAAGRVQRESDLIGSVTTQRKIKLRKYERLDSMLSRLKWLNSKELGDNSGSLLESVFYRYQSPGHSQNRVRSPPCAAHRTLSIINKTKQNLKLMKFLPYSH